MLNYRVKGNKTVYMVWTPNENEKRVKPAPTWIYIVYTKL